MFKTSGGKYVVPPLLEGQLKQSLFIEQVMVIGEGEKMPAALIQPDFLFIKHWIERKRKGWKKMLKIGLGDTFSISFASVDFNKGNKKWT